MSMDNLHNVGVVAVVVVCLGVVIASWLVVRSVERDVER